MARERKDESARLAATIDKLVEDNRRMAQALSAAERARNAALAAAEGKQREAAAASAASQEARTAARDAQKRLAALEREMRQLRARGPVPGGEKSQIVTPDGLAVALEELIDSLKAGPGGIDVQGGTVNLKVGLTETAAGTAFVVPRADQPAERIGPLHEVHLTFDRHGTRPAAETGDT